MAKHFISIMFVSRALIKNCVEQKEALEKFR